MQETPERKREIQNAFTAGGDYEATAEEPLRIFTPSPKNLGDCATDGRISM